MPPVAFDAWLQRTGYAAWAEELAVIVTKHHHLTPYRGRHAELAERAVRNSIDVGAFFTRVVPRAILRHLVRHPLDPLPIVRAHRALRQAGHDSVDR